MMKADATTYVEIDAKIRAAIKEDSTTFSAIMVKVGDLAKQLGRQLGKPDIRVLDSRLQALSKKGELEYDKNKRTWRTTRP